MFIALRFFPHLMDERKMVIMALKARGIRIKSGFFCNLKLQAKIIMPLFTRVIKQVDDVATAVALKSYKGIFFTPKQIKLSGSDLIISLAGIVITMGLIIL